MIWFNFTLKLNNKICAKLQVKGWVLTPTFIPRKTLKRKVAHLEKNQRKLPNLFPKTPLPHPSELGTPSALSALEEGMCKHNAQTKDLCS